MKSLNWSEENKKAEKSSKVFTPNIYRKPIEADDIEKEVKKDSPSASPLNYIPGNNQAHATGNHESVYKTLGSDIEDLLQKESALSEIKKRYESNLSEYEEKQKELDELKSKLSEQEKELKNKCVIMKSAVQKAEKAIPPEQKEALKKEIAAFEEKRSAFETQVKEFEDSRLGYEKEFAEYTAKMEELSSLRSTYESELEKYNQQKCDLDEKRRYLEKKLLAGEEISIDLADISYPAAIEVIKSDYYAELKELNRKRADIETLRCELEDEESVLTKKRSSIEGIKGNIHTELTELGSKTGELEASRLEYEESVRAHEEKELAFKEQIKTLEAKKADFEAEDEKLSLKHEENIQVHKEKELAFQEELKALKEKKAELEAEDERLRQRREDNSVLEMDIEKALAEMESKRKELEEMVEKTSNEIGTHVTIHRQNLDIKKLNNKLEQQMIYIQSLESSVSNLKRSLEEARFDVKKNEVFSQILKQNMDLMG
ncbi:hypothetical protein [uncultured Methanolobus sp.]|uniref:hypothetical protein n=1 Tax=uncultured Methanolobus sp. TaxID=218300 RepID=UPI0029C94F64|nr:hypothetical protein [uncultured Methanolobus sp.]